MPPAACVTLIFRRRDNEEHPPLSARTQRRRMLTRKDDGYGMDKLYNQLAALAHRYGARRLVLFGSRARGDNRYNSDIDLAVYGMPESRRAEFWLDCEELPTLLKFDIVHIKEGMNPAFLANIEREGVTIYAAED